MTRSVASVASLCALLATATTCSQSGGVSGTTTGASTCSACPTNSSCQPDGTCKCSTSYSACPGDGGGTICIQLQLDNDNCGECGTVCPLNETCLGGNCECHLTTCPIGDAGETICTDPVMNPLGCGPCGLQCSGDQHCLEGSCTGCSPPTVYCGPDSGLGCIDVSKDPDNCGGCGVVCGPDAYCAARIDDGDGGICVCLDGGPGTDMQRCEGSCVDLAHDRQDCGTCDNICPFGACTPGDAGSGVCGCDAPFELCGSTCIDPYSDYEHCGGCTACSPPATQCVHGNCQ